MQRTDVPMTAAMLRHRPRTVGASDSRFLNRYQDWQDWARRFSRTMGIARFANGITANACARCILQVEERDANSDWNRSEAIEIEGVLDGYCNQRLGQDAPDLVRLHAWHYGVAGEGAIAVVGEAGHVDWLVLSTRTIEWDTPKLGFATIKLVPNGTLLDGTAFVVPRSQLVRFWNPDEEWPGYATSPMAATVDDLRRIDALARWVRRTADNRLAMSGLVWTGEGAHARRWPEGAEAGDGTTEPISKVEHDYADIGQRALEDDDDLAAVLPPMFHWDREEGKPEWVEIGRGLDEKLLAHLEAAYKDFARGQDLPTTLVVEGGPGSGNHWSDWLVDRKFFQSGIAPTMDRVTHADLTRIVLYPYLVLRGLPIERFRIGYDASPVIVNPDRSSDALALHVAGLLKGEAVLEAGNFDVDDMMDEKELARLLEILAAKKAGTTPSVNVNTNGPAGPENVEQLPPAEPRALPARTSAALNPTGQGAMVYLPVYDPEAIAVEGGEPPDAMHLTMFHMTGDVAELDPQVREQTRQVLLGALPTMRAPDVDLSHVERFPAGDEDMEPVVMVSDAPGIYEVRERLRVALQHAGVPFSDDHAFRAHVTLGYWPTDEGPAAGAVEGIPHTWTPDHVGFAWGEEHEPFPFGDGSPAGGGQRAAAGPPEQADDHVPEEPPSPTRKQAARALDRLASIRRDLGRRLLTGAETVFASALRHAGVKVQVRARRRAAAVRSAVAVAVDAETNEPVQPLGPHLADVGITEEEMLDGAFDTYERQARRWVAEAQRRRRAALEDAGLDPDEYAAEDDDRDDAAVAAIIAGLGALARQRLTAGPPSAPPPGEVTGDVPATLVSRAIDVVEGRSTVTLPETTDALPSIDRLDDAHELERTLIGLAGETPKWAWVHGFYGEPDNEFEPHAELHGVEVEDPDAPSPDLSNLEDFPEFDQFFPGDHPGCTCEWVATVEAA